MKRTREHTSDAPNAKRTKTEQVFEALNNLAQNLIVPVKNWLLGEQTRDLVSEETADEQPNHSTIVVNSEEFPLVDDHTNTVNEIDPDLEAAIAFSLIADIDADEESNKVEENLADKIVPYGCHENAQNIIMDFRLLWEQDFLELEISYKFKNSKDKTMVFRCKKFEEYKIEIITGFDKLSDSLNETAFQRTLFKMTAQMLWMHNLCYFDSARYMDLFPAVCKKVDSFLNQHGLIEPIVTLILEKNLEMRAKYQNACKFIDFGQVSNRLIDRKSLNRSYDILASFSTEELISHGGAIFEHGFQRGPQYAFIYEEQTNEAKDSLLALDRKLFFMANQICFNRNVPPELVPSIVLPSYNYCCVLNFSEQDVYTLQKTFREIQEGRDQKRRLMSNK